MSTLALCIYGWTRPLPANYVLAKTPGTLPLSFVAVGAVVVGAMWLKGFPRTKPKTLPLHSPLTLLFAAAFVAAVVTSVRGETQGYAVAQPLPWTLTTVCLILALHPPKPSEILPALRAFSWTLALAVLADLFILGPTLASAGLTGDALDYRTTWQTDFLGIASRWSGPFPNTHVAGIAGAWLIVFSAADRSRINWILMPIGVVTLALSDSRSAVVVCLTGVLVLLTVTRVRTFWRLPIVLAGLVAITLFLSSSPSGNGRVYIWATHLSNAARHPFFGNGPGELGHAHNTFIDTSSRYGLAAGACLTIAILWAALRLAGTSSDSRATYLPMLAVVVVGASLDTLIDLVSFGFFIVPLVLILTVASVGTGLGSASVPQPLSEYP